MNTKIKRRTTPSNKRQSCPVLHPLQRQGRNSMHASLRGPLLFCLIVIATISPQPAFSSDLKLSFDRTLKTASTTDQAVFDDSLPTPPPSLMMSESLGHFPTLNGLSTGEPGMDEEESDIRSEWSGHVSGELRWFPEDGLQGQDENLYPAFSLQAEYLREWNDGYDQFTFTPFMRVDYHDSRRTHADIRELSWVHVEENYELRMGVRKVFWGVTESQHLVDIINQSDLVESTDGEEKLGQPMFNIAFDKEWGMLDLFVLPFNRLRTYPGKDARFRTTYWVDDKQAIFESELEEWQPGVAVRWMQSFGDWDVGLSHFSGMSRDPRFIVGTRHGSETVLIPYYERIDQTGLDIQATLESWLLKLEAISRSGQGSRRYAAATAGFEYTLVGIFESDADLGFIAEYLYDDRREGAPTPFQNDLMLGMRLAMNDEQSTEALFGVITDLDHNATLMNLEGSRRLGDSWKLSLEGRALIDISDKDPLTIWRRDQMVQLELTRYF
ncbi:MAG: hypothetical protein HQL50_01080 [Magnetococcales bacterium]|nr:hypothetical protein [Magnetococcales bacterium]